MTRSDALRALAFLVLGIFAACGPMEVSKESMERWERERYVDPESPYGKELAAAQEARRARDGFEARLVAGGDSTEVEVWKTKDRKDDGSKGTGWFTRAMLEDDDYVLVIDSADVAGQRVWKIVDADMTGWVPAARLKRSKEPAAYPDPSTVPMGAGVDSLSQLTASPFCAAFRCALGESRENEAGEAGILVSFTGEQGWWLRTETREARLMGARLSITHRGRDTDGRARMRAHDRPFAILFVRTVLGAPCPAAEALVAEMNRPVAAGEEMPSAECGGWAFRAAQDSTHTPTLYLRRAGE